MFKHWAGDVAPLFARTLPDDDAFPSIIILGPNLSAVPRSLGGRWLRRNGLAECIAAECGYALRVGANAHFGTEDDDLLFCPNEQYLHDP